MYFVITYNYVIRIPTTYYIRMIYTESNADYVQIAILWYSQMLFVFVSIKEINFEKFLKTL